MSEKETLVEAAKSALDKAGAGESLDTLIASELNERGWIVKQISVVKFEDGSYAVAVSNNGRDISVEVKP